MSNTQLKIFCTNIRSLNAQHYSELLLTLELASIQGLEYDIIALTETWVSNENMKLFRIENYVEHVAPRIDGRRSGGVVFYVKKDLKITGSEILNIQGANLLKLKIEYPSNQYSSNSRNELAVYLIYRDCTSSRLRFVEELEQIIQNEKLKNSIFLGDMNINLLNSHESADYLNMFMSQGCLSYQNAPTRDHSCLDHVFSNINAAHVHCKLLEN